MHKYIISSRTGRNDCVNIQFLPTFFAYGVHLYISKRAVLLRGLCFCWCTIVLLVPCQSQHLQMFSLLLQLQWVFCLCLIAQWPKSRHPSVPGFTGTTGAIVGFWCFLVYIYSAGRANDIKIRLTQNNEKAYNFHIIDFNTLKLPSGHPVPVSGVDSKWWIWRHTGNGETPNRLE